MTPTPNYNTPGVALIAAKLGLPPEFFDAVFSTYARCCNTDAERVLYLAKCDQTGIHPLSGDLVVEKRLDKKTQTDKLVFISAFRVYQDRAKQEGWIINGMPVRGNDDFAWDAVAGRPLRHLFETKGQRGPLIGCWVTAMHATKPSIGFYASAAELASNNNYLAGQLGDWLAMKTLIARVSRMAVPGLGETYVPEEFGRDTVLPADPPRAAFVPVPTVKAIEVASTVGGDVVPDANERDNLLAQVDEIANHIPAIVVRINEAVAKKHKTSVGELPMETLRKHVSHLETRLAEEMAKQVPSESAPAAEEAPDGVAE